MDDFVQAFEERLQEIEAYLDLLDALEKQVQDGTPHIGGTGPTITVQQQRILYSSVFLQLYNLVESTITHCVDAVTRTIEEKGPWQPGDLSDDLRREWARHVGRTHTVLNFENRLAAARELCEHLVQARPVSTFTIEKGAGGSWDDREIQKICERIGFDLNMSSEILRSVKEPFRNDQGALRFIKELRNGLAHGSMSFAESSAGVVVSDLRDLKERTVSYLRSVVSTFKEAIDAYKFLLPERRPSSEKTGE